MRSEEICIYTSYGTQFGACSYNVATARCLDVLPEKFLITAVHATLNYKNNYTLAVTHNVRLHLNVVKTFRKYVANVTFLLKRP
jgi:hypothetical protein